MAPPFRAEHIGSLLRPQELTEAHKKAPSTSSLFTHQQSEKLQQLEKGAIASVVHSQLDLSIRPITSGEYERHIFYSGFFEKIPGFEIQELPIASAFRTNFPTTTQLHQAGVKLRAAAVCTSKIKYSESPYLGEWTQLRSLLPASQWRECKVTMPALTWHHMQLKQGTAYDATVYTDDVAYFQDLAAAYRAEFMTLYKAGLRSIQIDDPNLTFFFSPSFLEGCEADGIDADALLDLYVEAHNLCLTDLPEDLHVGIHLCRGNFKASTHFSAGSYEQIAPMLFGKLDYATFYLEYDSERAGGFEPLRFLPKGKNVVLGVVSTKTPEMENIEELKDRVQQAAETIAKAQGRTAGEAKNDIGVSPQCGFSSSSLGGGVGMTMDIMWKKLVLVRDLARQIWSDAV